ncbi:MAG: uncharacterized protein QOG62_1086 [Thermoleophilaceae bacterium]|nr:uncharacterized protein [Thermoleophilaceae bacterium]
MTRIGVDIDSTLHHYWDQLERIALARFGVRLPYAEQTDWMVGELARDQLIQAVRETHSDENIVTAIPYPDAVETIRAWHEAGHWIHITSHRYEAARPATEAWLERVGVPYDDLHCSFDKVPRCVELEVEILIDDSPVNIRRAIEMGITPATIIHPWNAEVVAEHEVVAGTDWRALAAAVDPLLR